LIWSKTANYVRWRRASSRLPLLILLLFLQSPPAAAVVPPRPTPTPAHSADYQEALNIADTFMWEWMTGKSDEAMALLSPRLAAAMTDNSWFREHYIGGLSNPRHEAFQIWEGEGGHKHYRFRVTLCELTPGQAFGLRFTSTIELVRVGTKWRVDHLPTSSDNHG
jgi:hypothetical protein